MSFTAPPRRPSGPPSARRRRGPLVPTLVVLAVLAVLMLFLAQIWTEVLWYDQLGFLQVLRTEWSTRALLFIAGFVVMMLDRPLPRRVAAALLVGGLLGTWAHNLVRVTAMLLIGSYAGGEVMDQAHVFAGYVMFPLWMLLFAYVYLRQWQRHSRAVRLAP